MGGMGGMGRTSGTMPSMMGMMMLSRMIMYFCGDPDSWDMRSLMIGMMGMRVWAAWAVDGRHGRRIWVAWAAVCGPFRRPISVGPAQPGPDADLADAARQSLAA